MTKEVQNQTTPVEERVCDCLASIAVSLKRIADALHETNEYGEGPAAAISGSIKRAMQR